MAKLSFILSLLAASVTSLLAQDTTVAASGDVMCSAALPAAFGDDKVVTGGTAGELYTIDCDKSRGFTPLSPSDLIAAFCDPATDTIVPQDVTKLDGTTCVPITTTAAAAETTTADAVTTTADSDTTTAAGGMSTTAASDESTTAGGSGTTAAPAETTTTAPSLVSGTTVSASPASMFAMVLMMIFGLLLV